MKQPLFKIALLTPVLMLAACGGSSSGPDVQANEPPADDDAVVYTGPAPRTADVSAFKVNLWDNLVSPDRCGACHSDGGQPPAFVIRSDINLAYNAANTVVSLNNPAASRLVTKVGNGHNCWLGSDAACASVMETWVRAWAQASIGGAAASVSFVPPPDRTPGATRGFPESSALFGSYVYPLMRSFCIDCHQPDADAPVQPYFAHDNVDTAYLAAQGVMNLDAPFSSRVVSRLNEDNHNCWSDDCGDDAQAMADAIAAMAAGIPLTPPDASLVLSRALFLGDGTPASGGGRYDTNMIARYEFRTGSGSTAYDTSGVDPALDLTLSGDVGWVGGWGIEVSGGRAQGSTQDSSKLHDLITGSGEFSLEAWVVPATTGQMDANIVSYSAGTQARNVTLSQQGSRYQGTLRHDNTDANGMPEIESEEESLQATLQHVVMTYSSTAGRQLYINGENADIIDPATPGLLNSWSDNFALVLGNEASGDRPWQGVLRFVAIHNRALTAQQISQNFSAGVGERVYLLFGIGDIIGVPDSYIGFLVSRFDEYGYLFAEPFFINLSDPLASVPATDLEGMRLGLNGRELAVGQVWVNLDTQLGGSSYSGGTQLLSSLGTVIPVERGQSLDEFFLTFATLGSETRAYSAPGSSPIVIQPGPAQLDIGIRTFDEINASMSALTGIPVSNENVQATFDSVRQQLPASEDPAGFLTAHQVGIAQLAIEYCNELVEQELDVDETSSSYFPGLDYTDNANDISDSDWRNLVATPLAQRMVGDLLEFQPAITDVTDELVYLLTTTDDLKPIGSPDGVPDGLARCGGNCQADQTAVATKAACATALASATLLIQ